jgi:hypothetical protein
MGLTPSLISLLPTHTVQCKKNMFILVFCYFSAAFRAVLRNIILLMFIYYAHKLICLTNQYNLKHHIERSDRNKWFIGPCFLLCIISCVMGFLIDLGQVGHSLFYLDSLEM